MKPVPVVYHHESAGWWADSPLIPGWSATAETLDELRALAEDGVRFALEDDDVLVSHLLEMGMRSQASLVFDFVGGHAAVETSRGARLRTSDAGDIADTDLRLVPTG